MGFKEACASWLDPWPWLWVEIPRRVSLQSKRLGCLYFVFMVGTLSYVMVDFVSTEAWHAKLVITDGSVTAWREGPAAVDEELRRHCTHPEEYDNIFSGGWIYRPRSCRLLTGSSAFRKQGNWLFFPTYLEETYTWTHQNCSGPSTCLNLTVPNGMSENVEVIWDEVTPTSCRCRLKDSYFAQSPEDEVLVLMQWYLLPQASLYVPFFGLPEWGRVLTIIRHPDGTPCEVQGRTSWDETQASAGIGASLREWMHCAGTDLDQDPNLLARDGSANLANHLRTMGYALNFNFNYLSSSAHREDHSGVVCYITVSVHVEWNSNVEVQQVFLPRVSQDLAEHQVYMYGVTPRFSFDGHFNYMSHSPIMTWLIQAAVLLALPATIMRYVVEFLIGHPSTIYRRETCRPFDIYEYLRKTQARMLISHAAYSQMSAKDGPMDMECLHQYMQDIYQLEMQHGRVKQEELDLLWKATLTGFDVDGSGKVSLQEFVSCASLVDDLHIADIVHFMDKERRVGVMEKILDSTRQQLLRKKSTIQPMKSVDVDAAKREPEPDQLPSPRPEPEANSPRELS